MPLIKIDIVDTAWEKEEIKVLLNVIHETLVRVWKIPQNDRYQIVNKHHEDDLILLDTGLGFTRSNKKIVVSITSVARTIEQKEAIYNNLVQALKNSELDFDEKDLLVNITNNRPEDWSFGFGEAQFMNGKL